MKQAGKLKGAGRRPPAPAVAPVSPGATAARYSIPLAVAAWAVLAIINYLPRHPINVEATLSVTLSPLLSLTFAGFLAPWIPAAKALGALILVLASAGALGASFLDFSGLRRRDAAERALYSFLLGLGAYAILVQGAGLLGFYSARSYAFLSAVSLLSFAPRLPAIVRRGMPAVPWASLRPPLWLAAGLGAIAVTQLATVLSGFTPPHISDELNTRLGLPKLYLWAGKITLQPGNLFSSMPHFDSMLYGLPVSFGLLFGVKWIHWAMGILAGWGIWLALRSRTREARWAVLFMFMTLPAAWIMAGRAFNDMMLATFTAGAVAAASQGRGTARAVLAGAFIGLAASNKYTGFLAGLTLLPFFGLRQLVVAGTAAFLVVLPWLARSFLWLGNPLFPYFYGILGGLGWDAHQNWRWNKELMQVEPTTANRVKQVLGFAWNVPIKNLGSWNDGSTGPLIMLAIPLVLAHATLLEGLALLGMLLPVAWTSPGIRFVFPLIPLAFPIMARGVEGFLSSRRLGRPLVWAVVAIAWYQALEMFPTGWKHYDDPIPVTFGQISLPRYLDRWLYPDMYFPYTYSRAIEGVEKNTPPGAKVLFLGGYGGGFYFPRHTIYSTLFPRPMALTWAREARDTVELRRKFRQAGVTHVLVNRFQNTVFYDYWKMWDWNPDGNELKRWNAFWDSYAVPRWHFYRHFNLYAMSDRPVRQPHQLVPGFEEESAGLALTLNRKKEFGISYDFVRFLLGVYPQNHELWLRLAEVLAARGEIASARACCEKVRELAPRSPAVDKCQAELALSQKRYRDAAILLERAAARDGLTPQSWADLYSVYIILGDRPRALQALHRYNTFREYRPYRF